MVAGAILVSIGLLVVRWLTGVSELWWTATTQSETRTAVQQAVSRMTSELKAATRTGSPTPPAISIPAAPNNTQVTFYLPTDVDGDGTIVDASGNTEWDAANSIQYVYDAPSKQLRRVRGAQTVILAHDVTSATFNDVSIDASLFANELKITLTLQTTTPQHHTLSATSTEIVKLRN